MMTLSMTVYLWYGLFRLVPVVIKGLAIGAYQHYGHSLAAIYRYK